MEVISVRQRRFSLMTKFSLVLFIIVFGSAAAYATFAAWQFKQDKLKYIHLVNSTFTQTVGQKLKGDLETVLKDIRNMIDALASESSEAKSTEVLVSLFKNNPMLVSLYVYRVIPPSVYQTEYTLFNSDWGGIHNVPTNEVNQLSTDELRRYLAVQDPPKNYLFDRFDKDLLFFIFPLNPEKTLFSVFAVSKDFLNAALGGSEVSELRLVRKDGTILSSKIKEEAGGKISDSPLFSFSMASQFNEGSTEFSVVDGGEREDFLGNFARLSDDMVLLSEVSKTEAFMGLHKILLNTVLFGLMTAAIAIIVGVRFSRSITLPLTKLMTTTEDIAAGRYDVTPDIHTRDEVGQLADYFALLGQKLHEREEQLEKAIDLANKDGMTGVFNHRHFRARFQEYFALAKRSGHPLSLILTDIDHFKKFNDTYGHQQGDQVIKDIAKILTQSARDTDLVARYGGEEFVVVLPNTDLNGAKILAERMRKNYESHKIQNINDGSTISSTCSLGVATLTAGNFESIDKMIEHADQNLYKAKKGGRNQVVA